MPPEAVVAALARKLICSRAVAHDRTTGDGEAYMMGVDAAAGSESSRVPKLTLVALSVIQGAGGGATLTVATTAAAVGCERRRCSGRERGGCGERRQKRKSPTSHATTAMSVTFNLNCSPAPVLPVHGIESARESAWLSPAVYRSDALEGLTRDVFVLSKVLMAGASTP